MLRETVPSPVHTWRFSRVGGLDFVQLTTADDLRHVGRLDQKLWTALACPVKGLEFDEKTLALIDADKDGRVRAPELIAIVDWLVTVLADPSTIISSPDAVTIANIKDAAIQTSAKEILSSLGRPTAPTITHADVADTAQIFAQTRFNGDGIVTAKSAGSDTAIAQVITEAIASTGGILDRSGEPGIDAAGLEEFFAALAAFDAWSAAGENDAATVLPLGDKTPAALAAVEAVRAKIDDYFSRCRLAAFDPRALTALNRQESEYLLLVAKDLSVTAEEISGFPLARIEANHTLPLKDGINPAWSAALRTFVSDAVDPLLSPGKLALTGAEWTVLKSRLAPFQAWQAGKDGSAVEALGISRVRELLGGKSREVITSLIGEDTKVAAQFTAIVDVDKLVRVHRDLYRLLLNFVSFSDFYDPRRWAVFQSGTLYLDSRSCDLCIRVDGPNPLAAMSKAYVAYCACTRPGGLAMTIAALVTQGDSDFLFVGRHGVFYDRQGRDWDAVITSIVDNPTSIRQAFWSPYKKFVRMIEEQAAKRAAAAEAASDAKLASAASGAVNADRAAKPEPKRFDVGTIAALGVAVSGLTMVLTAIIAGILGLSWWQIPLAVLGVLLLISGPSMIIAAIKLRQRTIGPILDGNGWAINGRVKINIPFGTSLTAKATLPPGAVLSRRDPYAEKETPRSLYLVLFVLLGAAAVWVRWDHNRKGHYFWQPAPVPVEAPAEPAAAPEATEAPAATPAE